MQETGNRMAMTLDEVREKFSSDRFATVNGAVMGGAIFALADFAYRIWQNGKYNKK